MSSLPLPRLFVCRLRLSWAIPPGGVERNVAGLAEAGLASPDWSLRVLVFVFGWVPYWLGGLATTRRFQFPDKENANLTPASFELAFEDVSLPRRRRDRAQGLVGPGRAAQGHRRDGPRPQPLADRDGAPGALRPRSGLERAPDGPAPPRRERRRGDDLRREGEAGRRGRRAASRASARRARSCSGACRSAAPRSCWRPPTTPTSRASSATAATARSTTRCATTWRSFRGFRWWLRIVPTLAGRGPGALLDGPPRRLRPGAGRRAGGGRAPARPAGAVRGQLRGPAHAEGDRVRPEGGRRARTPRCWSSPARATAAPGATGPRPTRPRRRRAEGRRARRGRARGEPPAGERPRARQAK